MKKPRQTKRVRTPKPRHGTFFAEEALKQTLRNAFEEAGYRRVFYLQEMGVQR